MIASPDLTRSANQAMPHDQMAGSMAEVDHWEDTNMGKVGLPPAVAC